MMLIGHSIAQSVHLMQRSSSKRNIPRKRSDGIFFCSGYWIVTFFFQKCLPVTERPSKRSSSVSLSSHFFRAIAVSPSGGLPRPGRLRRQPVAPGQRLPQPGEQEHRREEQAEDPGEHHQAIRAAGSRENRNGHDRSEEHT